VAITAVQRKAKGTNGASVAIGSGDGWATPTAGSLLVVTANSDATVTITNIGTAWTAGPSVVDGNGAYLWWKISEGTESTITCTPSVSDTIAITACEYSGNQPTPFDASNSSTIAGSVGTTTTSTSVTTAADGDLVIAAACIHFGASGGGTATSPSWTNSFANQLTATSGGTGSVDTTTFYAELTAGAAGSYSTSASWTGSAGDRQQLMIAFKAAAAAATSTIEPQVVTAPAPQARGQAKLLRSTLIDPLVLTSRQPLVVSASPRPPAALALAARSSLFDATTPPPLLVTPPAPVHQGVQLLERGALVDDPVLTTAPPLVVSPPYRPPAGEALLSRSSPFDTLTTAGPLVVGNPGRPGQPLFVSTRSSLVDVVIAPTTFTPAPLVVTAATARTQSARTVIVAGASTDCDCTVHRPFSGTVGRPSTGTAARPSTGVVQRPCVC
jgi:hypothetical protein